MSLADTELTKDEYIIVAHHRATKYADKKKYSDKATIAAEWFGFVGWFVVVTPIIISRVKDAYAGTTEAVVLCLLLVLLFIFWYVRTPAHKHIERHILQKWGIK